MIRYRELLLYRGYKHADIMEDMAELADKFDAGLTEAESSVARESFLGIVSKLIDLASSHGYRGNLWQMYLTYILAGNENPYSLAAELRGDINGTLNEVALHDFTIFKEMFDLDLKRMDEALGTECFRILTGYNGADGSGRIFNKRVRDRICELGEALGKAEDASCFKSIVSGFYKEFGVGKFGLHKAFRIEHNRKDEVVVRPITNISHVYLEDLVGYELAKKKLIDNTEAFVYGRPANNCLLFGDAGTGKSSAIKGIMNRYYDRGLRLIELYKHQFKDINDVIAQIKNRNYRFILYMDDLSFEEFEVEYKYLKAVIEGGLEKKPDNILIYATSNRRHLVKETWNDRNDVSMDNGIHKSDTMQEKLSLAYRFGVTIYFGKPDKKEFQNIVRVLAERNGIDMPEEELLLEANRWELNHGGLSGRTAQNFINYLLGKTDAGTEG